MLFVNPTHCHGFVGMTNEKSEQLILELRDHSVQDDNTYYHRWRVGDVVIWDEIATMHRGAADAAPEERRVMLRTIVHPNETDLSQRVMTKPHLTLRICIWTLLQYLVPGAGLAILAFIVSLFQSGIRAEYTRLVALGAFLVMLVAALLRVAWLFVASRLSR